MHTQSQGHLSQSTNPEVILHPQSSLSKIQQNEGDISANSIATSTRQAHATLARPLSLQKVKLRGCIVVSACLLAGMVCVVVGFPLAIDVSSPLIMPSSQSFDIRLHILFWIQFIIVMIGLWYAWYVY